MQGSQIISQVVFHSRVQRVLGLGLGLASPGGLGLGLESSPEMIKSQVLF